MAVSEPIFTCGFKKTRPRKEGLGTVFVVEVRPGSKHQSPRKALIFNSKEVGKLKWHQKDSSKKGLRAFWKPFYIYSQVTSSYTTMRNTRTHMHTHVQCIAQSTTTLAVA